MINNTLIEKALSITWKSMEDMKYDYIAHCEIPVDNKFSIEKFCYYLLSPEFVEKYSKTINWEFFFDWQEERVARMFWLNIYRFQSWDEEPLIDLLSKIWN